MKTSTASLFTLGLSLLVAACGTSTSEPNNQNASNAINGTCEDACNTDADCDSDEVCGNGACEDAEVDVCDSDADCDSDESCTNGACEDTDPSQCDAEDEDGENEDGEEDDEEEVNDADSCTVDADCDADEGCSNGECEDLCSSDADCEEDETCGASGICEDVPVPCSSDADCDADEICSAGYCAE